MIEVEDNKQEKHPIDISEDSEDSESDDSCIKENSKTIENLKIDSKSDLLESPENEESFKKVEEVEDKNLENSSIKSEDLSDSEDGFPDTNIQLHHVSGGK